MQLSALISVLHPAAVVGVTDGIAVTSVAHDSRQVRSGSLFCCVSGAAADGHDFAASAVASGATALLVDHPLDLAVPQLVVRRELLRRAMGLAAQAVAGNPAEALLTCGVTGTNGKTTVTQMLGAMSVAAGHPTTVIGTLSGTRTTPEAPLLAEFLADARDEARAAAVRGVVAMEVSSHALTLGRVEGICFDVAAFTNLSHDHLDFHATMEEYFAAKASLFTKDHCRQAVVVVDDPWGARLADQLEVPLVAVEAADAQDVEVGLGWSRFTWRGHEVSVPLTGRVNIMNALVALASGAALGLDAASLVAGLRTVPPVPGRLEVVATPLPTQPTVLVDYAHTPAGLETVLGDLRALLPEGAALHVLFGCGGDRDPLKRPLMGEVAARLADRVTVTSDNPRSEDPAAIAAAVLDGVPKRTDAMVTVELDRTMAIVDAVAAASPGDVVLIAGKGHELHQEVAGEVRPLSDVAIARQALERRSEAR